MTRVTRVHARGDRIAFPWLLLRFPDPGGEIQWVPASEVIATAERIGGTPFDVPDVEYGHHGQLCSFDAFLQKHGLGDDPALARLALIVRGADTGDPELAPESAGLLALASGFWVMNIPDEESLALQTPLYDALYVHCGGSPR
jgi:hypothetical protein